MVCDKKNYVFFTFLKHIFGEIQFVNKKFETESNDPRKLLMQIIYLLSSKVTIPGRRISEDENIHRFLVSDSYLGYEFEKHLKNEKKS